MPIRVVEFLVLVHTLSVSIVDSDIFYGNGRILFAHYYQSIDRGLQIFYRPENYQVCKYTDLDPGCPVLFLSQTGSFHTFEWLIISFENLTRLCREFHIA